jgi:hypothetical protein
MQPILGTEGLRGWDVGTLGVGRYTRTTSMGFSSHAAVEANAGAAARRRAGAATGEARWGRRAWIALWLVGIAGFAGLHAVHLRADFPNHSPWMFDWAKYTDEGWYGDAAVRAHLDGNWYRAGDFNPAVAVPVWPLLEWVLFCFTGVTVEAARTLAVAVFFVNLALSYALLRAGGTGLSEDGQGSRSGSRQTWGMGTRWAALLAVSLLVTSPFLYCFSRLAILEPLLMAWTLAALNLAVRLKGMRRPVVGAAGVGALAVLAALTKTTAIFLLPALVWAVGGAGGAAAFGYGFPLLLFCERLSAACAVVLAGGEPVVVVAWVVVGGQGAGAAGGGGGAGSNFWGR